MWELPKHDSKEIEARRNQLEEIVATSRQVPGPGAAHKSLRLIWVLGDTASGKSWLVHKVGSLLAGGERFPRAIDVNSTEQGDCTLYLINAIVGSGEPNLCFVDVAGESVKNRDELYQYMCRHADACWYVVEPDDPLRWTKDTLGNAIEAETPLEGLLDADLRCPMLLVVTKGDMLASEQLPMLSEAAPLMKWLSKDTAISKRIAQLVARFNRTTDLRDFSFSLVSAYPGGKSTSLRLIAVPSNHLHAAAGRYQSVSRWVRNAHELSNLQWGTIRPVLEALAWPPTSDDWAKGAPGKAICDAFEKQNEKFHFVLMDEGSSKADGDAGPSMLDYLVEVRESRTHMAALRSGLTEALPGWSMEFASVPPPQGAPGFKPSSGVRGLIDWTYAAFKRDGKVGTYTTSILAELKASNGRRPAPLWQVNFWSGFWLLLAVGALVLGVALALQANKLTRQDSERNLWQVLRSNVSLTPGAPEANNALRIRRLLPLPTDWNKREPVRAVAQQARAHLLASKVQVRTRDALRDSNLFSPPVYKPVGNSFTLVNKGTDSVLDVVPSNAGIRSLMTGLVEQYTTHGGSDPGTLGNATRALVQFRNLGLNEIDNRAVFYLRAMASYKNSESQLDSDQMESALQAFEAGVASFGGSCPERAAAVRLLRSHSKFRFDVARAASGEEVAQASAELLKSLDEKICGKDLTAMSLLVNHAFEPKASERQLTNFGVNSSSLRRVLLTASAFATAAGHGTDPGMVLIDKKAEEFAAQVAPDMVFWRRWTKGEGANSGAPVFPGDVLGESVVAMMQDGESGVEFAAGASESHSLLSAIHAWRQQGLAALISEVSGTGNEAIDGRRQQISLALVRSIRELILDTAKRRQEGMSQASAEEEDLKLLQQIVRTDYTMQNVFLSLLGMVSLLIFTFGMVGCAVWILAYKNKYFERARERARAADQFRIPRFSVDHSRQGASP